jgi:predicted secreted protein
MTKKTRIALVVFVVTALSLTHFMCSIRGQYPEGSLGYLDDNNYFDRASKAPSIETLKYLYIYEYRAMRIFDVLVDFSEGKLYASANLLSFNLDALEPGCSLTDEAAAKLRGLVEEQGVWNWKKKYSGMIGQFSYSKWTVSLEYEDGTVQVHKGVETNKPAGFEELIVGMLGVAAEAYPGRYDDELENRFESLYNMEYETVTTGTIQETKTTIESGE